MLCGGTLVLRILLVGRPAVIVAIEVPVTQEI